MRPAFHFDPPLAAIPAALKSEGIDAFQTTLRDPQRYGKTGIPDVEDQAAYQAAAAGLWGIAHGSLLINLASPEGRIRNSSKSSLLGDLALARDLGLAGVCFHVGYAKGHSSVEAALTAATRKLGQVIEAMPSGACAIIENSCEGTEIVKEIPHLGQLLRDVGAPAEQLRVLIDTCHLHAAGFDLSGPDAAERLAASLDAEGLLDRLVAFHLNDCQVECGGGLDRHEVPGDGTIGEGLLSIVHHPVFAELPMILELSIEGARRGVDFLTSD